MSTKTRRCRCVFACIRGLTWVMAMAMGSHNNCGKSLHDDVASSNMAWPMQCRCAWGTCAYALNPPRDGCDQATCSHPDILSAILSSNTGSSSTNCSLSPRREFYHFSRSTRCLMYSDLKYHQYPSKREIQQGCMKNNQKNNNKGAGRVRLWGVFAPMVFTESVRRIC
jgi:hypothetical protein